MTGLCLGKYAPLHKGHIIIIEKALSECDRVIAFIYDSPDIIDIPLSVRRKWIEKAFNYAEYENRLTVVECWNAPQEFGYTKKAMKLQEDYILKKLNGTKIDRFYSAEKYGKHVSVALNADDCRIKKVNGLSATKVRTNPHAMRLNVEPFVYNDMITKVVFMGGVSCGKSTMTEVMAKKFKTEFMPEYGREYWEIHQENRRLTPRQLCEIAKGHIEREDEKVLNCNKYLFVDTNAITTFLFHRYYFGDNVAPAYLRKVADACQQRYDFVFLCDNDIPYDSTEDRSGNGQRALLQKWTIQEFIVRKIPFKTLTGSIENRKRQVIRVLAGQKKWVK